MRRSNGTGGYSLASMNQVIALTNSYYLLNGMGIQFYFAGSTPDYIDNDEMYNSYNGQSVDAYDAPDAMNQYYVNQFSNSGLGGYAYYPDDAIYSTRSFILNENNIEDMGNRLVPHELGHNFNLIHTFGNNNGAQTTTELVVRGAGENCTTDGDLICDTPADPYGKSGTALIFSNGCPQYDPNSTARDAGNAPYSPSITNIMSYYFPCTHDFTPGQYDRIQAALALRQTHTAYTLNAPATNVTAPGNLTGTASGMSIILTWQDNATNEMGYFIERSGSPDGDFVPIGGVEPNVSTYTDNKVVVNVQYYYRIRPSNTTTGSLSTTFAIKFDPSLALTTTNITGNTAQLNWSSAGSGVTYTVQYRAVGSTNWNTTTNYSGISFTAYGLLANTLYEWQVKATASAAYSGPVSFMTTCPVAAPYPVYTLTRTTAQLSWSGTNPQTYTVEWRPKNTPNWNTTPAITSTYYTLTGLMAITPYEWRVQATCPGSTTVVADFSPVQSFTTVACPIPSLYQNSYGSTSASLRWYTNFSETGRTSTLRYRVTGTADWTTISGITTQNYSTYTTYSLTGLTPNTTYEAQVESVCSPTEESGFSASITLTPACPAITNASVSPKATTASLSWNTYYSRESGTTFEVQYRPQGSTNWATVQSLTAVSPTAYAVYSLTGLTSNTTYEWRVRANCQGNAQSGYTNGSNFTTGCFAPVYPSAGYVTNTSAVFNWNASVDAGTKFDIRFRVVGAADWSTLNNLTINDFNTSFTYNLTGLTNNTQYEWQVRTVCSPTDNSGFVAGQNFTTACRVPYNLSANAKTTFAILSWQSTGPDVTYELRYRPIGTPDWTTVGSQTTASTTITGLQPNRGYEWQVRGFCSGGVSSDFSASQQFGTLYCSSPSVLYVSEQTPTSAKLSWNDYNGSATTTYDIQYRIVGTPTWTVVSGLTATNYSGMTVLTNLATDSQYEVQIRTVCTPIDISTFSASTSFQTCSVIYTVQAGLWYSVSTWSCNRVPLATDVVQIKHAVTVPSNYTANALRINYDAGKQLIFEGSARLMLGQ